MSELDFDSDDSINDPDFICEQNLPSCSNGRVLQISDNFICNENYVLDQNLSNDLSETSSSAPDSLMNEKFIGVNKVLFSEQFFKILRKMNTTPYQKRMCGLIAVCQICGKNVKGSLRVSSNFIKHLKKEHPQKFCDFKSKKEESRQSAGRKCSFNRDILNFICNTTSPLSIVSDQSFKKLFPGKSIPSRRSITRLLSESHIKYIQELAIQLDAIEYVCVTADVWSGGKKSFFGYTCHWINDENFERKSVALACRRFKGTHSFDRVTKMICDINKQYKLPIEKIVYTITDNGSNFIKAFKEFGVELRSINEHDSDEESDSGSDSDGSMDASGPQFRSVTPQLSKHFPCASHTLNLLATTDFNKVMYSLSQVINDIHKRSFNRCTQLWNKCNRPKSAEIINAVINANLLTPCITRWNSLYDSVKRLLLHKTNLAELCFRLKMPTILSDELEYLEEYIKLMGPIAEAIDFLQGEKTMYFGYFVPTIVTLRLKMRRLEPASFKYLSEVSEKMQEALIKRFDKYFLMHPDAWDAVIAAISIPNIKLRFLKALLETATTQTEEEVKKMFNTYVVKYGKIADAETRVLPQTPQKSFLDFGEESNGVSIQCVSTDSGNYLQETILYLVERDTTTNCLKNHPAIKNVFLKYNTPLPSSAPVERLFSFAGIVNRSRRQKLSDVNFEMLVLRKANSV